MLDSAQSHDGTHETVGVSLPNLSAPLRVRTTPNQQPRTNAANWRQQLHRLAPLSLPLLPIGAGGDGKAPADPATGDNLGGWTTAVFTPEQVAGACSRINAVGTRTGPEAGGLIAFDIDGATGIAHCLEHGCDPATAQTWQVHRDTAGDRLKVCWRLPAELWDHLDQTVSKHKTKEPSAPKAGDGENVATYYGSGQVVVLGQHISSGGNYFWPADRGPEALAEIPPEWWELALQIAENDPDKEHGGGGGQARTSRSTAGGGDWFRPRSCVICGRNKQQICRQKRNGEAVRCYHGSSFHPPELKCGETIDGGDGSLWAFTKVAHCWKGGTFSNFVLHKERSTAQQETAVQDAAAAGMRAWSDEELADPEELAREWARELTRRELERQQQQQATTGTNAPSTGQAPPQPKQAAAQRSRSWDERNHRKLSHNRAMRCFDRCVEVQAQQERNSLKRRARLLKALHDLGLAKYINRAEISQRVLEAKDQQQGRCFEVLTAADRLAMPRPTVSWLIPGLIPEGDATIIGGRPKVGKTRLAYALAAALLTGKPVLGFEAPEPRPVIVISDDQGDGDTADMLTELGIYDHPSLFWSRNFRLTESDLDRLLQAVNTTPGALVIFDSLRSISRSLQYGENDPELGAIIYDLKEAVVEAGGTPLLIHHCNKTEGLVGIEALSGHSAIPGAANTILTVAYLPDDKGRPQKDDPQRRLHREARSGKGFDLVIAPVMGTGTFERVAEFGDWQKQQKKAGTEADQIGKMPEAHKAVLALLCKDREKWFTRREVCEAKGIAWGDRGGSPEARKVWQSLKALARDGFADEAQQGREATYRAAGVGTPVPPAAGDGTSHGTQLMESMESMESSSDTKGFHDSVRLESMESRADVLPGHHGSPVLDSIDSKATESSDQLQGLVDSIDSIDSTPTPTPEAQTIAIGDQAEIADGRGGWQAGYEVRRITGDSVEFESLTTGSRLTKAIDTSRPQFRRLSGPAWLADALAVRAANPPKTHPAVLVNQAPLKDVPGLTGSKVGAALAAYDRQQGAA